MMWFFAILIVLALGGVAAFAAGSGAPLAEEYADRPDALVPATGPLGAQDLRTVRFSLAFRGYRMSEVDALLDRLATEREDTAWSEGATSAASADQDAAAAPTGPAEPDATSPAAASAAGTEAGPAMDRDEPATSTTDGP